MEEVVLEVQEDAHPEVEFVEVGLEGEFLAIDQQSTAGAGVDLDPMPLLPLVEFLLQVPLLLKQVIGAQIACPVVDVGLLEVRVAQDVIQDRLDLLLVVRRVGQLYLQLPQRCFELGLSLHGCLYVYNRPTLN